MTPEERTDAILSVLTANGRHVVAAIYDGEEARQRVVAHVREVIAEEREACAKLADRCTPDNPNHADDGCCASDIAAAIRGRA